LSCLYRNLLQYVRMRDGEYGRRKRLCVGWDLV
jgi:hypothetical protein